MFIYKTSKHWNEILEKMRWNEKRARAANRASTHLWKEKNTFDFSRVDNERKRFAPTDWQTDSQTDGRTDGRRLSNHQPPHPYEIGKERRGKFIYPCWLGYHRSIRFTSLLSIRINDEQWLGIVNLLIGLEAFSFHAINM